MEDNLKIAENFSRCAKQYDRYCDIQNKTGAQLIEFIRGRDFYDILEIGCGTGNYTHMLRHEFRSAKIEAFDISGAMVEVAHGKLKNRDIDFKIADANRVALQKEFDLITSNACFQWLDGLEKALGSYKKSLGLQGAILFSVFGPRTFYELSCALSRVLKKSKISSGDFYDTSAIEDILNKNFKSVKIKEVFYKENFGSLKELLEKIKYSGIRGRGMGKVFFTGSILKKIERSYLEEFGGIAATYQVIFCYGEKK